MADVKFSQFSIGGELQSTDILVGLRSGVNTQFTSPSSGGGPFLLKANNLSDVANPDTALVNLGTGSGEDLIIVDSDFIGGVYQLPIPCPFFIVVTTNNPGNQIRLPVANVPGQSFSLGLGPEIRSINSTQSFDVADSTGTSIISMMGFDDIKFLVANTSTPEGSWNVNTQVFSVNGKIGGITLTGSDISANFTPSNYIPVNSTITGNLEGIDSYIGSHPQIVISWNGLTTPVNVTAGSGVDITGGVISLTGTGASAGYGVYFGRNPTLGYLSFTDTSTWKILSIPLTLDTNSNNIVVGNDTYGTYLQNTGSESGAFFLNFDLYLARYTNSTANGYYLSPYISANGISAPIIYNGGNDKSPFGVRTQNTSPTDLSGIDTLSYTNILTIPQNAKIYMAIQNQGSTNPSNNDLTTDTGSIVLTKCGDVGGTSAGVSSLNGLTGNVNITSSDSSLSVVTSGSNVNLEINSPIPISKGGTNSTSQSSNGINFFNGTSIISSPNFTFDGTGFAAIVNTAGSVDFSFVRKDSTANAQIFFRDNAGTNSWTMGIISADSLFHLITPTSVAQVTVNTNGNIASTAFMASELVATDSTKTMISANLSGDITTSGLVTTLATVNSNVGSFGSATQVGTFTVNAKGLITAASNVTISGTLPGGSAGGDLSGTYPNPTVAKINGSTLGSTTPTSGNILIGSGSSWVTNAMSGDATLNSSGSITIANNAVTNAKFRQSAATSVVGNSTGSTANVADISASANGQVLRESAGVLGFGSIDLSQSNTVGTSILGVANGGSGTSTSFTTGSVVFAGSSGVYSQSNTTFFWDNSNTRLYLGANSSSQTFQTPGVLNLYGTDGTTNNSLKFYTTADGYPGLSLFHNTHNNQVINFDAFYNGTNNVSSYSGSNFQIAHVSNQLQLNFNSGTAQGSTFSWTNGILLDNSGNVSISTGNLTIGANSKVLQFTLNDSDKILMYNTTNDSKIDTASGWNFNFRAGNTSSANTGLFNWYVSGASGWAMQMQLTNGGDLTLLAGNSIINVAGKTVKIKQGTNACAGVGATMTAGAVTVSTTAVATGDIVLVSRTTAAGTLGSGMPTVTISNGVSFTLTSSSALETSTYSWVIIKAA